MSNETSKPSGSGKSGDRPPTVIIDTMANPSHESRSISKRWPKVASLAAVVLLVVGTTSCRDEESTDAPVRTPTSPESTLQPDSGLEQDAADVATTSIDGQPAPTGDPTTTTIPTAELPLSADSLTGYWTNVGGRTSGWTALLVDFRRDGSFTIGNTGSLGDGAFAGGTYTVDGDTIVFTGGGGGCDGDTFVWTTTDFSGGRLNIDVAPNGGCAPDAGWNWVRVSPASPAGLELTEGTSGATPRVPEAIADLVGIWLRVGTGEVLAIDARGSYVVTTAGDTLSPDDTGEIQVEEPGVVVFASDGTGACQADETWAWTEVKTAPDILRDGNPRGTTMRADTSELCGSSGSPSVWRLLSPDLVSG